MDSSKKDGRRHDACGRLALCMRQIPSWVCQHNELVAGLMLLGRQRQCLTKHPMDTAVCGNGISACCASRQSGTFNRNTLSKNRSEKGWLNRVRTTCFPECSSRSSPRQRHGGGRWADRSSCSRRCCTFSARGLRSSWSA